MEELKISEMTTDAILSYLTTTRGALVVKFMNRRELFIKYKKNMGDQEWFDFNSFINSKKEELGINEKLFEIWEAHKKANPTYYNY